MECLSRLGCVATILGMPLTTLVARHDIVTVSSFFSYFTLPLTHSPDRRLDLPRWSSDFHGDQRSLHFRSCPFPCLPSPRQGRGCRSRGRRSPCHLLRAQCWSFSASISPFIHIPVGFYDSSSGLCFDFLRHFRYSSLLSMAFAVHIRSTAARSHIN